jgi:quercetin dioxygenase-like cupin family protein
MIQVRNFREFEAQQAADGVTMRVVIGPDQGAPHFTMRVFEVQPGHSTPLHSHWWEHEIFVLAGEGAMTTDQGERLVGQGSTVFVPGGEQHRLRNTGGDVLRFICMVPQEWLQAVARPSG